MRPAGYAPQPAMPQQPYPYPPQGYPPYPQAPYGAPGYPPPDYPPAGYPPQQAEATMQQQIPVPTPEPEPEPEPYQPPEEPEAEEEEDALPGMDDLMAEMGMDGDDEDDDASEAGDEDENLSVADIDSMFGDADEPEAVQSIVEDDDEDDEDDGAFDDLEEPEPIPQVFTAAETGDDEDDDEYEDEGSSSKGKIFMIAAAVVLVLILGIGGAMVFLKDTVVEMLPSTEGIYAAIGLVDDSPGAGLSINDVKSTRESIAGKDVLVVRGVLVNISDRERNVPLLELQLSDLDGNILQRTSATPLKTQLAAGDQIGFKIQLEQPSDLARRMKVTFVEAAGGEHGSSGGGSSH